MLHQVCVGVVPDVGVCLGLHLLDQSEYCEVMSFFLRNGSDSVPDEVIPTLAHIIIHHRCLFCALEYVPIVLSIVERLLKFSL